MNCGAMLVVLLTPLLDEMLGLSHRVKEIPIQTFALEGADKAFDEGVFPGMAGFDVDCLAAAGFQPGFPLYSLATQQLPYGNTYVFLKPLFRVERGINNRHTKMYFLPPGVSRQCLRI